MDGTEEALDARDRQNAGATASSNFPDPDEDPEKKDKKTELKDGDTLSEHDALVEAEKFLGEGYNQAEKGRYVSADGLRQVRMKDVDILGKHADGPHMNFENLKLNPLTGKMAREANKHIYLK